MVILCGEWRGMKRAPELERASQKAISCKALLDCTAGDSNPQPSD